METEITATPAVAPELLALALRLVADGADPAEVEAALAAAPAIEVTGPNTWAVSQVGTGDDALTSYRLLAGPGIPGVVAPR